MSELTIIAGQHSEAGAKEIAALVHPRTVSVEVTTNDLDEMLAQAKTFASWAPNIVIKIPQVTQDGAPCYGVISQLEAEGIKVVATPLERMCLNCNIEVKSRYYN